MRAQPLDVILRIRAIRRLLRRAAVFLVDHAFGRGFVDTLDR